MASQANLKTKLIYPTFAENQQDLVGRARSVFPILRQNAEKSDVERRVADESIAALDEAQLFATIVPRRWGGQGASMETLIRVCEEVSKACPSTGWVHYIASVGAWIGSLMPDQAQREIFANGPIRQCGVAMPGGKAQRVDGGYRVTGRWPYASGSLHAQWASVTVALNEAAQGWFEFASIWVPIDKVRIEDTWQVAGMRGTGSNTLVLDDVFVPEHMVMPPDVKGLDAPRRELSGEPSDRWTFRSFIVASSCGAFIGIAQGMLDEIIQGAGKRRIAYTTYARQDESSVFQRDVGECALKIDAARTLALKAAREIDQAALEGRTIELNNRARIRAETSFVAQLCREAAETIMSLGGASAFANSNMLQRHWRDISVIARHGFIVLNPALELYGRNLLGVEPNISPDI